ncbi:MAG TPA: flagellar hook-associated protein FlgK [Ideonella sp.]|nr:flagellar hook-associated protein FlgK [Ideonella sp.]
MSTLYNALSGALAAQTALNTTSQNIANVMTEGYTRQGTLMAAVAPSRGGVNAGGGVTVPSLIRFSDNYKSLQMWQAASELGQRNTSQPYLTQLEQVMGSDTASINTGLDAFFSALNAASVEPTSSPLRQQVITAADALAQRVNSLQQVLTNQRSAVYQQRSATVTQVNTLSANIAELNKKITAAHATGVNNSSLIDQRDRQIDELAGLIGVQVVDQPDGSRSISLRGGQPLVVGSDASTLSVQTLSDGTQALRLNFAHESFSITSSNLGGELGGLNDFERDTIVPMMQSVVEIAGEVARLVNDQLAAGYAMDGSSGAALPLFEFDPTSASGLLKVRSGTVPQDLAFSSSATEPGNSDNLLALIEIPKQTVTIGALGNVLLGDAYTQLVSKLAMQSQQNQASLTTAETVRTQAEESWKSTSGVNQDEEAINLMQYQQMYQANMKVIAVANELFDSTLAMI